MRYGQSVVLVDGDTGKELILGGEVVRVKISAASLGDNTVVAAVTDKKIKVLAVFLIAAGAVNVKFQSGAGGTDITGLVSLTTNSGFVLPSPIMQEHHWFETAAGALLNINLSGNVQVSGCMLYYVE